MGTGLKVQRLPAEWEKRPLELGKESEQGPMVTSRPTSRDLDTEAESRAQAPLPGDVNSVLQEGGTDYVASLISSRPGMKQEGRTPPTPEGDKGGFGVVDLDHTTGKATKGQTKGRGTF